PFDFNKIEIKRGKLNLGELPEAEDKAYFKRYEVTEDGVSPRVVPGQKHGIHHVTGVEHSEIGTPSESASNRQTQMDKRMRKLEHVHFDTPVFTDAPHDEADVLILGFGSTKGAIEEVRPLLDEAGIKANHAHIRLIHPFPTEELQPLVDGAKKVIVVENNATGQLASILKMNMGAHHKVVNLVKYDGTPFLPLELLNRVKELLK
ncbi:MAG: 2-oxoacid:acceptor oxidoreductase subunit alpha, partial [Kurthia sp.]|nr:2-oxoacid:acceptor oxidoreductase subunit alpha [Kurthia sp.]